MKHYDLEEERVKKEILKLRAKRILIQLPDGLKSEATHVAKFIERLGVLPIISAHPCYGACDLAIEEAESLGADLLIHYGHAKLVRYERVPTLYVEARSTVKIDNVIEKALPLLTQWQTIGLATTVQHVQTLDEVREILTNAGKTVVVGDAGRLNYAGQVIGCDYSNVKSVEKDVDAFLFVGGGRFHALGIALSTSKPTVVADPYDQKAFQLYEDAEKIVKQRWAVVAEAQQAKTFGILIGLKRGQKRIEEALLLKKKLEENGKTAYLLSAEEITPQILIEFSNVDAFVNTACPRVSIDDNAKFKKPILTINEAYVVVGELSWEELCRKGLFES